MMRFLPALSLLFLLVGCSDRGIPFAAPPIAEVQTIHAEIYSRRDGGANLVKIEFPKAKHESILDLFDGAKQDTNPMKWEVLGRVDIVLTSGSIGIRLFWTGNERGAFKVEDTYYRGGSGTDFTKLISDVQPSGR